MSPLVQPANHKESNYFLNIIEEEHLSLELTFNELLLADTDISEF